MNKMKPYILIIIIIISGCAPKPVERSEWFLPIDFTKYTSLRFLITPEKYNGDYESIGLLSYKIFPSIRSAAPQSPTELKPGEIRWNEDLKAYEIRWGNIIYERIMIDDVIEEMYKKAREMGADAIT